MQKDDTLKAFGASKMIRELRFSIEAARLKNATYPPSLSAITNELDPGVVPISIRFQRMDSS